MAFQCIQFTPGTHDETIYRWKELLKTCGWSVVKSSDGTNLNTDGTSDKITGYGTGTGGLGNANAWFVVQMPSTFAGSTYKRQICVQRLSNGPGWYRIAYSLVGFTKTTGTSTVAPTANDEVFLSPGTAPGQSFNIDANNTGFFNPITSYPYRSFMGADDAAPYGFWCANIYLLATTPPGSAVSKPLVGGSFMFDPMAPGSFVAPLGDDATTGDIDPYVWHHLRNYTFDACGTFTLPYMREAGTHGAKGWFRYGNADAAYMRYIAAETIDQNEYVPVNRYNGKVDLVPLYWFYPPRSGLTAYPYNLKGASSMVQLVMQDRGAATTLSVASSQDKIVFGNLAFPWNGTNPTI